MDILTEKGQISQQQELDAVGLFLRKYPALSYIHTPKNRPVCFDGFVVKDNEVKSLVEVKCRNILGQKLKTAYNNEWLITYDKFLEIQKIAEVLYLPITFFFYLVPEKTLLVKRVWDPETKQIAKHYVETRNTQATVNGGRKICDCMFIDVSNATVIKEQQ